MKAVAGRPQDIADIQALAAYLGLSSASEILAIITRYVPPQYLKPDTRYLVESLFPENGTES